VVYVKRGEDLVKTLCILDTAAGHSTIDKGFALSLGFELTDHEVKKINYLDRKVMLETARCEFELVSQDKTKSFKIQADAVKGFADNCLLWPWHKFVPRHPHLKDVNPPACPMPPIGTILIGVDYPDVLRIEEYVRSKRPQRPMAVKTALGWGFFWARPSRRGGQPRR